MTAACGLVASFSAYHAAALKYSAATRHERAGHYHSLRLELAVLFGYAKAG